jgi:hypothetical protein|tara:strand:+ start:7584 stop:8303 length:720 start_codon:yes stop_codon:yes gene_type:complete
MKKAIVIGATSGIGRELAKVLAKKDYIVGLVGRRTELLSTLQKEIATKTYYKTIDISKTEQAMTLLEELIKEMGGMDLIVLNSAVLYSNPSLNWNQDKETIDVNISGFVAMANVAGNFFFKQGHGHIVGISSVTIFRTSRNTTVYCASKAFVSNYLGGLRHKLNRLKTNIYVTEILPGFVATQMINNRKGMFWIMTPQKAARCIYDAIKKKKKRAYITKRWFFVSLLLRIIPDSIKGKI